MMKYIQLYSLNEVEDAIATSTASLFYFSSDTCSICKVLRPKISELLTDEFPLFNLYYVNTEQSPLIAGQFRIFSIPTLLVYFEGKEFYRKSRNISIRDLADKISRPYSLMFNA